MDFLKLFIVTLFLGLTLIDLLALLQLLILYSEGISIVLYLIVELFF